MKRFVTRTLFAASLGLSLTLGSVSVAQAQHGQWHKPVYQPCPPVIVPYAPTEKRPTDLPPGEPGATPTTPTAPIAPTAPPAPAAESLAGGGGGSTGMIGRGDQNSRFNLFDHMAAIPQNRAWFGFQYLDKYNSGLALNPAFIAFGSSNLFSIDDLLDELEAAGFSRDLLSRQTTFLYRAGMEMALSESFSISAQWEFFTVDGESTEDGFNNPQILFKYVLHRGCTGCVVSATLGFELENTADAFEFQDHTSAAYPGMLFYKDCGDWIVQGGTQFRVPFDGNEVRTFDWALSLGYWLYRNPGCCDSHYGCGQRGCGHGCGHCGGHGGLLGIIPQIELLGKHVVGDSTITNPFESPGFFDLGVGTFAPAPYIYQEPRNVIDLTVGVTVLLSESFSIASGVSFPLTNDEVRSFEYILYLNYGF